MKQEVSDVQQRLQEAEMRNQELTTTISQSESLPPIVLHAGYESLYVSGCL